MLSRTLFLSNVLRTAQRSTSVSSRFFSSLPEHILVPMPALSPTMESGSIANWLLKEGDAFEAGQAICEVETDKATVTYDATDDGYIAKILVGSGEIEVGTPMMVTVEERDNVSAFANYMVDSSSSSTQTNMSSLQTGDVAQVVPVVTSPLLSRDTPLSSGTDQRVVASPLARRLAREAQVDLSRVADVLGASSGSGPHGRMLGADILRVVASGALSQVAPVADAAEPTLAVQTATTNTSSSPSSESRGSEVFASFQQQANEGSVSSLLGALSSQAKKEVPHYYLSVEVDVSKLLSLIESLGENSDISVQDILVKAAAKAMEKVPAVNAAWMDSFVRQYDQVDVNLVIGEGSSLQAPVLRNVGGRGLSSISQEIKNAYDQLEDDAVAPTVLEFGTFTIHNLGMYGVQSAAAIVLPPQACALSLGAIVDTVVPNPSPKEGDDVWKVSPILVSTLSCDHRVIDGAVGAGWLKAFKAYAEDPLTLLL